jgi:hypothetical protein
MADFVTKLSNESWDTVQWGMLQRTVFSNKIDATMNAEEYYRPT